MAAAACLPDWVNDRITGVANLMRTLIIGSSPLAVYLAAQATLIGQPQTWLADPFTVESIQRAGGVWLSQNKTSHFVRDVAVTASYADAFAESYDAVLFAMPGYEVTSALFAMRQAHVSDPPPIVALQHGVGNFEQIESVYGVGHAVRAALTLQLGQPTSGGRLPHAVLERVVRGMGGVGLDAGHRLAEPIAVLLRALHIPVRLGNGKDLAWSALLWQIYGNAIPTLLDMPFAEIRQNSLLFQIEYRQLREALTIIEALGVRLIDLPGAPVNALANQLQLWPRDWLPNRLITPDLPGMRTELALRIPHSEAAYLNGAIAIAAYDLHLNAPINHALALTVQDVAEGRALWSQFRRDPRSLEALIGIAAGRGN